MLLFVFAIRIAGTEVRAAGAWKGYAVYRDGVDIVVPNVNDHAGIMDENTIRYAYPVTHAKGPGGTVRWASWEEFLDRKNYLGLYKPKGCTITSTRANSFSAKTRELHGISYDLFNQIAYSAGSSTYVLPEHITQLRCDGVVEYTYEWYGWRVGGSNTAWDITRNSTQNYNEHSGTHITPRKQHEELLAFVISTPPV